ncbi:acyl-CoA dehydrogenase family protein [Rhizobium sp. 2MFCol3.1]|uniref:acyl-CoA dehydrogenase family protein n=1 Tax=Rhizobium sp. 2MFCol3.1 TaxID=1246459 RepID=UPI0003755998|nr:acyl-CoA dehydrogenase family protein [Rhizobium sp. 2MFCol3.1]
MNFLMDRPSATAEQRAQRLELMERARALVPLLAKNAKTTEDNRRVVEENIQALEKAGLYAILRPARFGGLETDVRTSIDVQKELALGCASTSWVFGLGIATNFIVAMFSQQAQEDVWGDNNENRICAVTSPDEATAVRVAGGWKVSGNFRYASGSAHAQWAIIGIPFTDEAGNFTGTGMGLAPMSELTVEDTWFVSGMRGTASNTLVAKDVFIPDHRIQSYEQAFSNTESSPHKNAPLYRSSFGALFNLCLAVPTIGGAEAALSLVIEKAKVRKMPQMTIKQSQATTNQLLISKAAMLIDSANLHLYNTTAITDEAAATGEALTERQRARNGAELTAAVHYARDAVRLLVQAHGSATFAESNVLQRHWRDCETASTHFAFNEVCVEQYGKVLLDIELGYAMQN